MAHVCNCTNQCPGCGSCCQIACGCRRAAGTYWPQTVPADRTIPVNPPTTVPLTTGEIRLIPQHPLTEADVKRIVGEALEEALREIRELVAAPSSQHVRTRSTEEDR